MDTAVANRATPPPNDRVVPERCALLHFTTAPDGPCCPPSWHCFPAPAATIERTHDHDHDHNDPEGTTDTTGTVRPSCSERAVSARGSGLRRVEGGAVRDAGIHRRDHEDLTTRACVPVKRVMRRSPKRCTIWWWCPWRKVWRFFRRRTTPPTLTGKPMPDPVRSAIF